MSTDRLAPPEAHNVGRPESQLEAPAIVREGVAGPNGAVADEHVRDAVRVAAENAPARQSRFQGAHRPRQELPALSSGQRAAVGKLTNNPAARYAGPNRNSAFVTKWRIALLPSVWWNGAGVGMAT